MGASRSVDAIARLRDRFHAAANVRTIPMTSESNNERRSGRPKSWSEIPPPARKAMIALGVLEAIVTTIALRDLARRPSSRVRGWKPLWLAVLFVQPIGAPSYLIFGRRASRD